MKRTHQLPIIIEKDEDGFYTVECPIFSGCYSQGRTIDEALTNIREVIDLSLEEEENIIQAHRAYVLERVENENIHILRRKNRKFEKFVVNNDDDVSDRIIEYARHWAVAMQQEMREGYKLHEIAEYTSNFVNYDGITDRMFFLAVVILSHFWKHGKKLREWYNLRTQLAKEGEEANQEGKIVHPTVIKIVA